MLDLIRRLLGRDRPKATWLNPRFVGPDYSPGISPETAVKLRSVHALNTTVWKWSR